MTKTDIESKFQMVAAPFWNQSNCYNSVTIAHIRTKSDTESENDVLETDLASNFTSDKSNMASAAILKFNNIMSNELRVRPMPLYKVAL